MFPKLRFLDDRAVEKVHVASLRVLGEVGCKFFHDEALRVLDEGGAEVDFRENLVKFPEHLVKEAVGKSPRRFPLIARNPENTITIGDGNVYFSNGFGAINVLNTTVNEVRPATLDDLRRFTLLCDHLEHVHVVITHVIPQDVPREVCDRYIAMTMLQNTSKVVYPLHLTIEGFRDEIRMLAIVFGSEEALKRRPIIRAGIQPTSPLQYRHDSLEFVMILREYQAKCDVMGGPIAGATAPPTLAGTLVLGNAEVLAGLVLCQMLRPGTPFTYGSMATIMDPRRGVYTYAAPELALLNVAFKQMADHYGVPFSGTGGTIDSLVPDPQAAYETAISNLLEVLAGEDYIHDGVYGILESGKTACYEQLLISHEAVGMCMRILEGIEVSEETLAVDLIKEVGPGRSYLEVYEAVRMLRERMFKEYWLPSLTMRVSSRREWRERGAKDIVERAREEVEEILREHTPDPPLDKEAVAELKRIAKEAEKKYARKGVSHSSSA